MRTLFKLRRNKQNREAAAIIYCRIKVDGIHSNDFSTFIKVLPREWNSEGQRVKGDTVAATDINLKLGAIKSDIDRLFLTNPDFSAQELADSYTGKTLIIHTFSDLVNRFLDHCTSYYDERTLNNYKTRINNIRLFLEEKKLTKLRAERITLGHGDDFVRWMKTRGKDHQYIVRHTQILKNMTEDAVRQGILKTDPLAVFRLKKMEKINTSHLSASEIRVLETFEWMPELQRVVDIFLFSIYTGLHYEDSQTIQENEIRPGIDGRLWLFKPRGKYQDSKFFAKGSIQVVPLHPKALLLIEKYGSVLNLPKLSNVHYNRTLKQIQYMAQIKVKLSVKIARKTFTDVLLNELGVSEESVAVMLGHESTRHVRHYARADERRIAKEVIW